MHLSFLKNHDTLPYVTLLFDDFWEMLRACMRTLERVTLEKDGNKRKEAEIVAYNSLFQILMMQNCSSFKGQKVSALEKV